MKINNYVLKFEIAFDSNKFMYNSLSWNFKLCNFSLKHLLLINVN